LLRLDLAKQAKARQWKKLAKLAYAAVMRRLGTRRGELRTLIKG
jgi:hypothetical protein